MPDKVDELVSKYKTNDPIKLIKYLDCGLFYDFLGYDTLGITAFTYGESTVIISNVLSEPEQQFVAAHELGHVVSGVKESTKFLRRNNFGLNIPKLEADANRFAFKLLMYNLDKDEPIMKYKILDYYDLPYSMERFMEPQSIMY
ncbi:ImmA/IrrE family metallo-endopeptidase [Bombilactobacillus bombi]|uniref:ImmA/IrrE family metallo-endopeptidase n=1 Tax=Bombilactobacillus bombi TaxID=1303590 RepID=UPI0015F884FD|nr:ImmA/IrrE family metallo-endopeptidase [Bombilactobacillus bombi]